MSDLLAGLDPNQRRAAAALEGPVAIIAAAGGGKTRTVSHRIAHGVAEGAFEASRTLALTFTTKASAELGRRLEDLGAGAVATRTFHSAALRQLQFFWEDTIGGPMAKIASDKGPLISEALGRCNENGDRARVRTLTSEVDWFKSAGLTASNYVPRGQATGQETQRLRKIFEAYEDVKSDQGVIDFEDVLLVMIGLMQSRSDVREKVRRAYRWFTVDEFQDVSPLQMRLLRLWLGKRHDICVVGDPAQAIYGFAGADAGFLTGFAQEFPQAQVFELNSTYRCDPAIATAANAVASNIPAALSLQSVHSEQSASVGRLDFPDEVSEGQGVADEIAALVAGGQDPGSIACLFRIRAQSQALEVGLQRAQVPYNVSGMSGFFRRQEVKEALIRLRGLARSNPKLAASTAMVEVAAAMGASALVPSDTADQPKIESLQALRGLAEQFETVSELVTELDDREQAQLPPPPAAVTLTTLHAAKGLEWDTVFITGAIEGMLPLLTDRGDTDLAEERRLFYVGVTRARHRLVVTCYDRSGPGRVRREVSRFVTEMGATNTQQPRVPVTVRRDPAGPRSTRPDTAQPPAPCRECGRGLVTGRERVLGRCERCPDRADPDLLAALRRWRAEYSEASGTPEVLVLTQSSLELVATIKPQSLSALAELPGFHPVKLADIGERVLAVVSDQAASASANPGTQVATSDRMGTVASN